MEDPNKEHGTPSQLPAEEPAVQVDPAVEPENPTLEIDYAAELEAAKAKEVSKHTPLEKAIFARKKIDEEIMKLGGTPSKEEYETPLNEDAIVEKLAARVLPTLQKAVQGNSVKELITKRAQSPEEEALIVYHYENSIVPTGNLEEDVENAWTLANKKKLTVERDEAIKALNARNNLSGGSGGGQRPKYEEPVRLTPEQEKLAKAYGLKPEELIKK